MNDSCIGFEGALWCPACRSKGMIVHTDCVGTRQWDVAECSGCGRVFLIDGSPNQMKPVACEACGSERGRLVLLESPPNGDSPCALRCGGCGRLS